MSYRESIIARENVATGLPSRRFLAGLGTAEKINSATHGLGLILSLVAGMALFALAFFSGDPWRIAGCAVFAAALVGVYAASTLSHCVVEPVWRHFFRSLDQGLIYLLIVASYTPFGLAYMRFSWWWVFLAAMWAIALFGFVSKLFFRHRVDGIALWTYLLLGWLPIVPLCRMVSFVPLSALGWVLAGGLCYTFGALFLMFDHKRYYFHGLWHTSVIAGSTCHFLAVLLFVACAPSGNSI